MAAAQTDPTRVSIYILEEFSNDPDMPAQKAYRKVGIAARSYNRDPFYQRTRLFHQGNVRQLKVVHSFEIEHASDAKQIASGIEGRVHSILKARGFACLKDSSFTTGHSEWFKVSLDEAKDALAKAIRFEAWMMNYRLDYGYGSYSGEFLDIMFETKREDIIKSANSAVDRGKASDPDSILFSSDASEQQFRNHLFNEYWEKFLVRAGLLTKLPTKENEVT